MTAVAEIHIDYLYDALCVPTQAIVQRGDETFCYVSQRGVPVKRRIEVGDTNDKFVEIRSGLAKGDQVVLNPAAILGASESDSGQIAADKKNSSALGPRS
jgi:multidrug efflux pump subunit AcrA (membrane-fusion protein)